MLNVSAYLAADVSQRDFSAVLYDPRKTFFEAQFTLLAFRRMVYAVTPNETTYERTRIIPDFTEEVRPRGRAREVFTCHSWRRRPAGSCC